MYRVPDAAVDGFRLVWQNVQNAVRDVGLFLDVLAVALVEIFLHLRAVWHAVFFRHAADIAVFPTADELGEVALFCLDAVLFERPHAGLGHVFLRVDEGAVHIEQN